MKVTTAKIADGAITEGRIAPLSDDTEKLINQYLEAYQKFQDEQVQRRRTLRYWVRRVLFGKTYAMTVPEAPRHA